MPVHVGILGGGNISETHLRAAQEIEGVIVSAVCGENGQKVARLAEQVGAAAFENDQSFLEFQPMDVVLIGSPSGLHARQGVAAAGHGLHVLTEKPVDIKARRVDFLIESCRKAGVQLGVFFQDRVTPDFVLLKQHLDSGRLGRPLSAAASVRWFRPPEYYSGSRWRGTWELDGGGALMNQGIHTVDLLLWMLGPVVRVQARAATLLHAIEAEDTLVACLEFVSGALATLEATTAAYPGYPRRLEITTTKGTVTVEHDRITRAEFRPPVEFESAGSSNRNDSARSAVVSDVRGHRRILEDFLEAIRVGRPPVCDGQEGRKSVALVEAIYASARTGETVELPVGR